MGSIGLLKFVVVLAFAAFGLAFLLAEPGTHVAGRDIDGTIAAPTRVSASDGDYANKIGINWDTIRGANLYRVFRNTTNNSATATDVGTTAANYFFDATPAVSQTYFYWVRAENGSTQSSLSSPDQGTRAVGFVDDNALFSPLNPPTAPAGNDVTAAKAYLGKTLFWDEQLSSTRTVSCGTCHRPAAGGSDPRTGASFPASRNPGFDQMFGTADDVFGSPGVPQNQVNGTFVWDGTYGFKDQVTGRKSPTYLNAGYARNGLFWDGRATDAFRDQLTNNILLPSRASLESQASGPPTSSAEMAHNGRNWNEIAARVQTSRPLVLASDIPSGLAAWIGTRSYPELFQEAFGTPDVTPSRISMAIATHERTLFSDRTPFDRYNAQIEGALTQSEENGFFVFTQVNCNVCHSGALLTNNGFHNIGVRPPAEDRGRGAISANTDDDGRFKTPNLRNMELHAPYMHNGRFATVEDVVEFYDRGGDFNDAPNFENGIIRQLGLTTQEKADLAAFLKRPLTDQRVKNELPPFDRPKLYTESNRVPQVTGTGRAGSGAIVPQMIAISPPLVGNPNFTVSVSRALGNAQAVLVISDSDPGVGTSIPTTGSLVRTVANTQNTGAGNGWASVSIAIPNDQAVSGKTYFGRWYVTDAGAANGFAVSQLVQFTVFGNVVVLPTFTISGRVTTPSGIGLRNATVVLTDVLGAKRTATTSSFGVYQFNDVPLGNTYTMGVVSKRYRFAARIFDISGNVANFDFVGLE
ncbi:MAG: cytochrome c peroxidase [Pyrinomonadaceae bacterium]